SSSKASASATVSTGSALRSRATSDVLNPASRQASAAGSPRWYTRLSSATSNPAASQGAAAEGSISYRISGGSPGSPRARQASARGVALMRDHLPALLTAPGDEREDHVDGDGRPGRAQQPQPALRWSRQPALDHHLHIVRGHAAMVVGAPGPDPALVPVVPVA